MIRGTTPTIVLNVDSDLTGYNVYATFRRDGRVLTLSGDRLTVVVEDGVSAVRVTLTQEETLSLYPGAVEVQVRAVKNGTAIATNIQRANVGRVLYDGVID